MFSQYVFLAWVNLTKICALIEFNRLKSCDEIRFLNHVVDLTHTFTDGCWSCSDHVEEKNYANVMLTMIWALDWYLLRHFEVALNPHKPRKKLPYIFYLDLDYISTDSPRILRRHSKTYFLLLKTKILQNF